LLEPRLQSIFCCGYFGEEGFSNYLCLGCPPTTVFLISASQVARITGVSHRSPADFCLFYSLQCPHCLDESGTLSIC
jgi:hypothetical protein